MKEFFKEVYSYGIIIRAPLESIERMKVILKEEFPEATFVYQKYSKLPIRLVESKSTSIGNTEYE